MAQKSKKSEAERIANLLHCAPKQVQDFKKIDPINPQNEVHGWISRKEGRYGGSLFIVAVNGRPVNGGKGHLVFGTPKLAYPYKDFDDYEYKKFPTSTRSMFLANKWNGMNVLFFTYPNADGQWFVSAKSKGSAFLHDADHGPFLSLSIQFLGETCGDPSWKTRYDPTQSAPHFLNHSSLHPLLSILSTTSVAPTSTDGSGGERVAGGDSSSSAPHAAQSVIFELCGNGLPHLVKYDFEIALKPLFWTDTAGQIKPVLSPGDPRDIGPLPFEQKQAVEMCSKIQEDCLKENEEFRAKSKLPHKYEYNHFAVEGMVLYCLDSEGFLIDRTMYKIKPSDIEEVHWERFDEMMQGRVKEALEKLRDREKVISEATIQEELDMGPKQWGKFGREVMQYVDALLSGSSSAKDAVAAPIASPIVRSSTVVLLTGLPGSGKTHFASQLCAKPPKEMDVETPATEKKASKKSASQKSVFWALISSSKMSKKSCFGVLESAMAQQRKRQDKSRTNKGQLVPLGVCVDCSENNNSFQRKSWVEECKKLGAGEVLAVHLDTPLEICKERVKERPSAAFNTAAEAFRPPTAEEGFTEILVARTPEEANSFIEAIRERVIGSGVAECVA